MRAMRCALAGLLAAAIVTAVAAQPGGGFGGFGGAQDVHVLVATNTALQDELKVSADQKEKLKPAADKQAELGKAMREAFGGGGGGGGKGGFDKEKMTEFNEKRTKINDEVKKIVDDALTADQKKRLHQIAIQAMEFQVFNDPDATPGKGGGGGKGGKGGGGFGGFMTDAQKAVVKEVAEALKLTDSQKTKVKGVVDEFNKESREVRTEAGIGGGFGGGKGGGGKQADPEKVEAANKKIDKLRKEAWGKVEDALTDTQKTAWKGLVGDAFDTSKLRPVMPKKD